MAVRTRRLGSVYRAAGGSSTVFTCPADRVAIIKQLTHYVTTGGSSVNWYITPSGGDYFYVVVDLGLVANAYRSYSGLFLVMHEGDTLTLEVSGATRASAHGTLLLGDAA